MEFISKIAALPVAEVSYHGAVYKAEHVERGTFCQAVAPLRNEAR